MAPRHHLVLDHLRLAAHIARSYSGRGIEDDDLDQVARLALVKAARHFDPQRGDFAPFAAASVRGEIKRHFRDFGWGVRPPRRVQELRALIRGDTDEPITSANAARLAAAYDVEVADIFEVATASTGYTLRSTDELDEVCEPGAEDPALASIVDRMSVTALCRDLDANDRWLLERRFGDQLSQSQIGALLGVSQVQVSRRLSALLARLRERALIELSAA